MSVLRDPLTLAVPFFIGFVVLEAVSFAVFADDDLRGYDGRDTVTSVISGMVALLFNTVARFVALLGYAVLYELTPLRLDPSSPWTWVGVLLAVDLLWYGYHRTAHRVRLVWAAHQAHHNSEYFNLSTAARQKWNPWFEMLFWVPLPLLGVPPWMIFTAFSFNLVFQFFVHTERIGRLPAPIEFVFNTPSHHRVHHASDPEYLDRNYGGVLIVWDRLFGTYAEETHRPRYGLTTPPPTQNVAGLQYHEFAAIWRDVRAATTWRARLAHVFAPPGGPAVEKVSAPS
ncbi:sterol desaturase family protein [Actinomycetospora corticicola]|uniref:Sterol desaturase/sphingolipid hydroxylase (Fatty acid hydroxylase superfamily) n=1 Tax=Actinomycetospora corticicola TaxID=663602 RepID=A0A7Y9J7J3_9PSEU|nr:sterol desaturase family protein [Actinomycetospora corticicola]NYD38572.1 sterol desaturase/sphingolipid hydroxylase (fatty acid hydroxylase superfamily) [Actinomycetospora corticicola]